MRSKLIVAVISLLSVLAALGSFLPAASHAAAARRPARQEVVTGTLVAAPHADQSTLLLQVSGRTLPVVITSSTRIVDRASQPLSLTALHDGDTLRVTGTASSARFIASVVQDLSRQAAPSTYKVTVQGVLATSPSTASPPVTLCLSGARVTSSSVKNPRVATASPCVSGQLPVAVNTTTHFAGREGHALALSALRAGNTLRVTGTVAGGHLTASGIKDLSVVRVAHPLLTVAPASTLAGGRLRVGGHGFRAGELVSITIDNRALTTTRADAAGRVYIIVTLPKNLPAGRLPVAGTGASSHLHAATTVIIPAPTLHLSASAVEAGGSVVVTGHDFAANDTVTITLNGHAVRGTLTDAAGAFSVRIAIPAGQGAGRVTIVAAGTQPARPSVALLVQARAVHLTLSAASAIPGGSLRISGRGFLPGEAVAISIPGHTLRTVTADAHGAFTNVAVRLPAGMQPGTVQVRATGARSRSVAVADLRVVARPAGSLTVSPATFTRGTPVRVSGGGFVAGERVALAVNGGAPFATAVADRNGRFVLTVTLPTTLPTGALRVTAIGSASHTVAQTTVRLQAPPPVKAPAPVKAGSTTWYFAAGRTDSGFSERIALLNPNNATVHGTITFFFGSGQIRSQSFTLRSHARGTYDVGRIIGQTTRVAAEVQASLPVAAARITQRGNADIMSTTGVSAPADRWYMAEGYTSLTFEETLSLLNPGYRTAHVHIVWPLFNGRAPVVHDVTLAPRTRMAIPVNAYVYRASHATVVTSDQPIVASRSILFGVDHQGADSKAGVTHGSTTLYFAEGSTNNGFEEYLTILNPSGSQRARVTAQFYNRSGALLGTRTIVVDPLHRGNIKVNDVVHDTAISTVLRSTIPIVAERAMYIGAPNGSGAGGTDVYGRATPAQGWAFASGDTHSGHSEFELLFNEHDVASRIQATYYAANGQTVTQTFSLPAHTRMNIDVTRMVSGLPRGYHGVILRSLNGVSFIAEQAIYANAMGNGGATVGTPLS